jgi:hypothetical protein
MRQSPRNDLAPCAMVLTALLLSSCGGGTEPPPPPPATRLVLVTPPSAVAETMVPLATQPVVQTVGASGQSVPTTTTITAEVVDGNGVVAAGGSVATDASGRATFSQLTLGALEGVIGSLTLRFSAPGLEPATAALDLRCAVLPLTIGQSVDRDLTTHDCAFSRGAYAHLFEVTTSQPVTAVRLTQNGTFGPSVEVRGPNEPDYYWGWRASPFLSPENRISYRVLLPAGRNRVAATSGDARQTGAYTLTVVAAPEDLGCEIPGTWAASPITTTQHLTVPTGDCPVGTLFGDRLFVGLPPNASISASMTSSAFQPEIKLADAMTDNVVTSATAEGTATVTFTNGSGRPQVGYLVLTSYGSVATGTYTLSVNITYASSGTQSTVSTTPLPLIDPEVLRRRDDSLARPAGAFSAAWSRP